MFSAAGTKHRARDCLNLCPKCTETRLRASARSKNFPEVIPPVPRFKGEGTQGRECKSEGGVERREWERKMKGRDGRRGMGGRTVKAGAP
jgi:hypothetical protein